MSSIIHLLNLVALRQYWNNYDFVSHSLGMIEPSLSFPERKCGLRGSQPLRRAHGTAWKSVPISAGSEVRRVSPCQDQQVIYLHLKSTLAVSVVSSRKEKRGNSNSQ